LPTTNLALTQVDAIDEYVFRSPREVSQAARETSMSEGISIAGAILKQAGAEPPKDEEAHELLMQRLRLQLGIRDRGSMADVLCGRVQRAPPPGTTPDNGVEEGEDTDHLSAAVRTVARAFEPVLRRVHQRTDLSAALGDLQAYLDALLALPPDAGAKEYVEVTRKHEPGLHRFLHALAKDEEIRGLYEGWYDQCVGVYQRDGRSDDADARRGGAGRMQSVLDALLSELSDEERSKILEEADAYAKALEERDTESEERLRVLFAQTSSRAPSRASTVSTGTTGGEGKKRWSLGGLTSGSKSRTSISSRASLDVPSSPVTSKNGNGDKDKAQSSPAPGTWLTCWQALIDSTPVTPATLHGPVRHGAEKAVRAAAAEGVVGGEETVGVVDVQGLAGKRWPEMKVTKDVLSERWERVLIEKYMK
jgi:hypothetical protein